MTTQKGYTANYVCLSTDVKPLDKDINSIMHELDTDKYYYFDGTQWNEMPNSGGGGGGFTPTTEQLAAMNSGITAEDVTQIGTNETNISSLQTLTQGVDSTGDNFIEINGVKLYFGSTTPSNPSDGDWWLN